MPSLQHTLQTLAEIARIRGREADAAALGRVVARLESGDPSGTTGDDPAIVRDALDVIRAHGPQAAVTSALGEVPGDLGRVLEAGGLDPGEAARLVQETGAVTARDVAEVIAQGAAAWLPASRRAALVTLAASVRAARPATPLGRAWSILEPLVASIRSACPEVEQVSAVGRARRYDAFVGGLGLLVATPDPPRTAGRLLDLAPDLQPLHAGPRAVVFRLERTEVTIRLVTPDRWGPALVWFTGSTAHVDRLARLAAERGATLDRNGLVASGRRLDIPTEEALYAALELPCVPPEMRESGEEVDAAREGILPTPIALHQVRGDLHMHSDWSDGRNTIDAMVAAAEALGYEYVALTDHSVSSGIARGLDVERLSRQRDAVAAVRERHPGIAVLHGAEVDILAGGVLDYPDEVLATLDVVLASLHDPGDDDGARLTDRYVAAMRHPLVQIVTHPTNRLVPGRAGYPLDEGRLFEAAAASGTLLEIDGAPGHLDMDGPMARRAIAAGVDVTVDGDCHRAEWLGRQMRFGVATARRGWVPAERVANTLPLEALRARLHRKRGTR